MSWFWRGFQSAVFYYVSCAPCSKLNTRRRRRTESRRAKVEKSHIEEANPELYRHPSPFSTNIYWREEMSLGPGPPPRKGNKDRGNRMSSSRELTTGGVGSSTGGSSADTTLVVESTEVIEMEQETIEDDGWNRRRYQRPDEILWGIENGYPTGIGQSAGLSDVSRSGTANSGNYYTARNPAVNDLHPPVVSSHPTQKSEIKWMLQPPPSAKIMEGKEKANRSRSGSGGSHGSSKRSVNNTNLSKRIGERLVEDKVRRGEYPTGGDASARPITQESRYANSSTESLDVPIGQRHDRDSKLPNSSKLKRPRPPPISVSEDETTPSPQKQRVSPSILSQRPILSPIDSSSQIIPTLGTPIPKKNHRRPTLNPRTSTSSLHILQDLVTPSLALNAPLLSPSPFKDAIDTRLPTATEVEDHELELPECESWFPGVGFRFPEENGVGGEMRGGMGIGRNEKARKRWSMNI